MRIFLDANILFSAARSPGAMRELLRLLLAAGHELPADTYVVEEARRNLTAKAGGAGHALEEVLASVTVVPFVPSASLEKTLPLPDKDRPVLGAAIRLACDVLVTGDRTHFGKLYGRTLHGVAVHSPRSLAESVLR